MLPSRVRQVTRWWQRSLAGTGPSVHGTYGTTTGMTAVIKLTFATTAPTWDEESTPSAQAAAVAGSCESRLAVSASRCASLPDRRPCAASHALSDSEPSSAQPSSESKARSAPEIFVSRRSRSASSSSMSPATGATGKQASAAASSLMLPAAPTSLSYMCSMPIRQQNTGELLARGYLREDCSQ